VLAEQLNSAKGRLRTILHRELYEPIDELLVCHSDFDKYDRHPNVLFAYELALKRTGAWPIESKMISVSANQTMDNLGKVEVPPGETDSKEGCHLCKFDFKAAVEGAISETKGYFDGLCLDCMDASQPKFGDDDEDYWRHDETGVAWDRKCRISHGQATWYYSFMGRRQKQINWVRRRRGQAVEY
jgi:hypothetical protein